MNTPAEPALDHPCKQSCSGWKQGYEKGLEAERGRSKKLLEALKRYEPMLRRMGCAPSGDHDDPSWCDEKCGDYGKQARKAISDYESPSETGGGNGHD